MELSACLPSLQAPAPSHNQRAFGCRYLDLVSTGEDETRKWLLQAPGLRFPELDTEAHALGEGLGSKPFCSGLRVALLQMPLDVHRAQLLQRNNTTEIEMERDVLRLGLLVGIRCILLLAFSN